MVKMLVFDMDGTLADLYSVEGWLQMLRAENPLPYKVAQPLYDMEELTTLLKKLKQKGWQIAITTWGAKNSSNEYNSAVCKTKKDWLNKYHFPYDWFYFQPYGTSKKKATQAFKGTQILIDDNAEVRANWPGATIDAANDILKELKQLL